MKRTKFLSIGIVLMMLLQSTSYSQVTFDHDKFSDAKKRHKSLVEVNSENLLRYDVKKLQIIECVGTFEINENFKSSEFKNIDNFSSYYEKKHGSKIGNETGEDYLETIVNAVYKMHQKILFENGLKTVNKSTVIENPVYKSLKLYRDEGTTYNGAAMTTESNQLVVSTSQMQQLPKDLSYDAKESFYQQLAGIANDSDSHAELKVHFNVRVNEEGNPLLTVYEVTMDTWLSAFKKGKETVYKWKLMDTPLFELKKEVEGNAEVMEGEKINMDAFDTELINMLKDITEMFSYALSDQFIKYQ